VLVVSTCSSSSTGYLHYLPES